MFTRAMLEIYICLSKTSVVKYKGVLASSLSSTENYIIYGHVLKPGQYIYKVMSYDIRITLKSHFFRMCPYARSVVMYAITLPENL